MLPQLTLAANHKHLEKYCYGNSAISIMVVCVKDFSIHMEPLHLGFKHNSSVQSRVHKTL